MEHLDGLMERLVSVFGDRGLVNLGRFTITQSDS
jgi:hypothetical protein